MARSHTSKSAGKRAGETDYAVGYGKPPVAKRFQKGQSGNPTGGSKKVRARKANESSLSLDQIILREADRKIPINENGIRSEVTAIEAAVRRLTLDAAKGERSAQKQLLEQVQSAYDRQHKEKMTRFGLLTQYKTEQSIARGNFRMEQTDMKPRDLIPFLGSKSRVSEIINGQRQPTVDQIRALHQHLGIPVAALVGEIKLEASTRRSTASKAAIEKLKTLDVMAPSEKFEAFMARATSLAPAVGVLRKSRTERTNAKTDFGALEAWCAAVIVTAENVVLSGKRKNTLVD